MNTANFNLSNHHHLNFNFRKVPESPLFIFPALYYLPRHDVNLEYEGVSFGFCFLRLVLQINIRQSSWTKKNTPVDLSRATELANDIRKYYTTSPDALSIYKNFEKNRWIRELSLRNVETTYYGLRILRDC